MKLKNNIYVSNSCKKKAPVMSNEYITGAFILFRKYR